MKDILQDIVAHTHALGFLNIVKVNGDDAQTGIDSMAEDRSVIMQANTKNAQVEMKGTFGMPNLNKLDIHLKCPEYKDEATIDVVRQDRNGVQIPTGIHFENKTGDFKNDYRFMNAEIINEKLKTVKFKGAAWDVEVSPSMASVQRFKMQATANAEETVFTVKMVQTSSSSLVMLVHTQVNLFLLQIYQVHLKMNGHGQYNKHLLF